EIISNNLNHAPDCEVFAACRRYPSAIKSTVESFQNDVLNFVVRNRHEKSLRYITQVEKSYAILSAKHGKASLDNYQNYSDLLQALGRSNNEYPVTKFSANSEAGELLKALFSTASCGEISFFIREKSGNADIYVIDEKGSLFYQTRPSHKTELTLGQFGQFFRNILDRKHNDEAPSVVPRDFSRLSFYLLENNLSGEISVLPLESMKFNFGNDIPVSVFVDSNASDDQVISILVDDKEFSASELGEQLYKTIASSIIARRSGQELYPVYINNLEFSSRYQATHDITALQTVHLLNFKKSIEHRLLRAISEEAKRE
ncbi:MAG: class I adenylate cyclase, partial [Pseudomonadota bacterium]